MKVEEAVAQLSSLKEQNPGGEPSGSQDEKAAQELDHSEPESRLETNRVGAASIETKKPEAA
jgi:hypothetical protein